MKYTVLASILVFLISLVLLFFLYLTMGEYTLSDAEGLILILLCSVIISLLITRNNKKK